MYGWHIKMIRYHYTYSFSVFNFGSEISVDWIRFLKFLDGRLKVSVQNIHSWYYYKQRAEWSLDPTREHHVWLISCHAWYENGQLPNRTSMPGQSSIPEWFGVESVQRAPGFTNQQWIFCKIENTITQDLKLGILNTL